MRLFVLLVLLTLFSACCCVLFKDNSTTVANETACLMSLHDVEQSLKANPYNIESIDDGFYPSNVQSSMWVIVNYYFNTTTSPIEQHPASFEAQMRDNFSSDVLPDNQFTWVSSPVFVYFKPRLMALFSGVYFIFRLPSTPSIDIVFDQPVCGNDSNKTVLILNKLTIKLMYLSSIEDNFKRTGFSCMELKNSSPLCNIKMSKNTKELIGYDSEGLNMFLANYVSEALIVLSCIFLVPAFLQKHGLLPITKSVRETHPIKTFLLWGFAFTSFIALVFLIIIEVSSIAKFKTTILGFILFPNPVHVIPFAFINLVCTCHCFVTRDDIKKENLKETVFYRAVLASIIQTIFLQAISWHLGWLILLLITLPAKIGVLCLILLFLYLAISIFVSGVFAWLSGSQFGKDSCKSMLGTSLLLFGLAGISISYQNATAEAGVHYQDGLSAIMPSLTPILLIGFLTWVLGGFKSRRGCSCGAEFNSSTDESLEVMWKQVTNGIDSSADD